MAITLSEAERAELVRRTKMPHSRWAEKARIILACADGLSKAGGARLVGVQAKTVGKWRRAFAAERMAGLARLLEHPPTWHVDRTDVGRLGAVDDGLRVP